MPKLQKKTDAPIRLAAKLHLVYKARGTDMSLLKATPSINPDSGEFEYLLFITPFTTNWTELVRKGN